MKKKKILLVSLAVLIIGGGIAGIAGIAGYQHFLEKAEKDTRVSAVIPPAAKTEKTQEKLLQVMEEQKKKEEEEKEKAAALQAEEEAAKAAEEQKKAKTAGRVVALDPGHQSFAVDMSAQEPNGPGSQEMKAKSTTGTAGKFTGIPEYQLTLDISLLLRTELESRGYQVVMTREDNETAISNSERALMASDYGADIYVRIHANGSENTSVNGALALVPSENNPYVSSLAANSYSLAELILNSYCGQTGLANKGIQLNDTMTGINWSKVPVIILEMGFMSNENDDYCMADASFRTRMVQGIADGIDQYFGVE